MNGADDNDHFFFAPTEPLTKNKQNKLDKFLNGNELREKNSARKLR